MTIRLEDLDFLVSDAGKRLLGTLAHEDLSDTYTLRLLSQIRRAYSGSQAGAALELARLRQAAVAKFGESGSRMFFTREALEQASDSHVRRWRASIAAAHGITAQTVVDVCCGIGSDALAFASEHMIVHGVDHDAVRIRMAVLNAEALALPSTFSVADARQGIPDADLIFFDPARRTADGRRIYDVEGYEPPLSLIRDWTAPRCWVKVSPGVDLARLPAAATYGQPRVYFVSVSGDLKEAMLCYTAGGDSDSGRTAVLLADGAVHEWESRPANAEAPVSEPHAWLCEPDPSVIRAGLVADVAARFDGALLDRTIAYVTTSHRPDTPWLRAWEIEAWMPFSLKRLREYLRARHVGTVTVKKRGTAVTPDILIPQLRLQGTQERVVVLTRLCGEQIAIVCQPYSAR